MAEGKGEILLYQADDATTRIQVRLEGDTVWLTQRQMAELFQKSVPTINEHIRNVFDEGELAEAATIRKFRIVQNETVNKHLVTLPRKPPCSKTTAHTIFSRWHAQLATTIGLSYRALKLCTISRAAMWKRKKCLR